MKRLPFQSALVAFLFTLIYSFPALSEQDQTPMIMGVVPPEHNLFCFNAARRPFRGTVKTNEGEDIRPLNIRARGMRRVVQNRTPEPIVYSISGVRVHRLRCSAVPLGIRVIRAIRGEARQCRLQGDRASCRRAARRMNNQGNRRGTAPTLVPESAPAEEGSQDTQPDTPDTQRGFDCNKADLNGDGRVNSQDLAILLSYWGSGFEPADLNQDGYVGSDDQSILMGCWGHTYDPTTIVEEDQPTGNIRLEACPGLEEQLVYPIGKGSFPDANSQGLCPVADSRVLYVASNGSDSNTGLSPATPLRSLKVAITRARQGMPDWILLKRGDTFSMTETLTDIRSGRSKYEPAVISSYGTSSARPKLLGEMTEKVNFFRIHHERSYFAISDLELVRVSGGTIAPQQADAIWFVSVRGEYAHFEGLLFDSMDHAMVFQGGSANQKYRNLSFVGNVITHGKNNPAFNDYTPGRGETGGLFMSVVENLFIRDNIFNLRSRPYEPGMNMGNGFHGMYLSGPLAQFDVLPATYVVEQNLVFNAYQNAIMSRFGGQIRRNLILEASYGIAAYISRLTFTPEEAPSEVSQNIVLNTKRKLEQNGSHGTDSIVVSQGYDMHLTDNIVAHARANVNHGTDGTAFRINGETGTYGDNASCSPFGNCHRLIMDNNIAYAGGATALDMVFDQHYQSVLVENNIFQHSSRLGVERAQSALLDGRLTLHDNFYYSPAINGGAGDDRLFRTGTPWSNSQDHRPWVRFNVWKHGDAQQGIVAVEPTANNLNIQFSDPDRDVVSYASDVLGMSGVDSNRDFVEYLVNNHSRLTPLTQEYSTCAIINYIRDGFDRGPAC